MPKDPNETAIIGANGNVGSELMKRFQHGQRFFRAIPRDAASFYGAERLFLVTPFDENMVERTAYWVNLAKREGIEKIVRLSAFGANPSAASRTHRWHGQCESIVEKSGIPHVFLRPNAFMQNFINHYGPTIRARSLIAAPLQQAHVSFVDAADIAEVAYHALLTPSNEGGPSFEITGPRACSFEEAARLLSSVVGREIRYVSISEDEMDATLTKVGVPQWRRAALLELYATYRAGEAATVVPSPFERNTLKTFFQSNPNQWRQ